MSTQEESKNRDSAEDAGERGHKEITIEINTRSFVVPHGKISFEGIVALAYPPQPGQPKIACTVTYHNKNEQEDKKLQPGQQVEVREGMSFTATPTNES